MPSVAFHQMIAGCAGGTLGLSDAAHRLGCRVAFIVKSASGSGGARSGALDSAPSASSRSRRAPTPPLPTLPRRRPAPAKMDDVPALVHISISLWIQPNDGDVFFKVDGSRFGQTRTVKLLTGSKYKIQVLVQPGAVEATSMNIGGVVFPLEEQSRDADRVVYHGRYDTEGVPHTKSGDRQPVQVSIQFERAGTFETVWQAKYYNYYKREHCHFGNKFSSIEYECKPNETRTLMWINKEAFN